MKKILCFLFICFGMSFAAFASDFDDVKGYTQKLIDDAIVKIFNKGVEADDRVIPFRKVLNDNFDFNYISKFVLGVYGRNVSKEDIDYAGKNRVDRHC